MACSRPDGVSPHVAMMMGWSTKINYAVLVTMLSWKREILDPHLCLSKRTPSTFKGGINNEVHDSLSCDGNKRKSTAEITEISSLLLFFLRQKLAEMSATHGLSRPFGIHNNKIGQVVFFLQLILPGASGGSFVDSLI